MGVQGAPGAYALGVPGHCIGPGSLGQATLVLCSCATRSPPGSGSGDRSGAVLGAPGIAPALLCSSGSSGGSGFRHGRYLPSTPRNYKSALRGFCVPSPAGRGNCATASPPPLGCMRGPFHRAK
ncbi:unnamed protein product [Arctogadus glacialis]